MPRSGEMVGACLGGGVGRAWLIGSVFGKEARRSERSEHLVGGNVQKAEPCGGIRCERTPVAQRLLQHGEGADEIRVDERSGAVDRTVYMGFRRQMDNGVRLELR